MVLAFGSSRPWTRSIPLDRRRFAFGILAAAAAGWRVISQRVSLGDFDVLVSADGVAICRGRRRPCFAYFGEARRHFEWTQQGLLVLNRRREVMLIPRRWFSDQQVADVSRWYAEPASRPTRSLYIQLQV